MGKVVAVGDIHGHFEMFQDLMHKLAMRVRFNDVPFVFLGDYVDGGPDTAPVVEKLRFYADTYPHWTFLQGNHEDMLLDAVRHQSRTYDSPGMWWHQGGQETTESYARWQTQPRPRNFVAALNLLPAEHLDWLEARPRWHETAQFFFAHAGFEPQHDHPRDMDPNELLWIRDVFIYGTRTWEKPVIFGHSVFPEPYVQRQHPSGKLIKIGIDTCRHNKGFLTAVILDTEHPGEYEFVHSFAT